MFCLCTQIISQISRYSLYTQICPTWVLRCAYQSAKFNPVALNPHQLILNLNIVYKAQTRLCTSSIHTSLQILKKKKGGGWTSSDCHTRRKSHCYFCVLLIPPPFFFLSFITKANRDTNQSQILQLICNTEYGNGQNVTTSMYQFQLKMKEKGLVNNRQQFLF